jgi:hypothetical protein
MMDAPPPPSYTAQPSSNFGDSDVPPPAYTFPTTFNIGSKNAPALVHTTQLKGHLALLHAFAALRSQVEGLNETDEMKQVQMPASKERRWSWFLGLAVER